jgi:hypothetical protein
VITLPAQWPGTVHRIARHIEPSQSAKRVDARRISLTHNLLCWRRRRNSPRVLHCHVFARPAGRRMPTGLQHRVGPTCPCSCDISTTPPVRISLVPKRTKRAACAFGVDSRKCTRMTAYTHGSAHARVQPGPLAPRWLYVCAARLATRTACLTRTLRPR